MRPCRRRRMRQRRTELPSFLVTVKPKRGTPKGGPVAADGSSPASLRFPSSTKAGVDQRPPPRTRWNWDLRLRVARRDMTAGSVGGPVQTPFRLRCWPGYVRPKDACDLWRDGGQALSGHPWSASWNGSRGGACERAGSVDRCVSRRFLRSGRLPYGAAPRRRLSARMADAPVRTRPALWQGSNGLKRRAYRSSSR